MARKAEAGLNYFPVNSDIVHNKKVKLVVAEFGPKAWAVLLPLYCRIYREKGYWVDWMDQDSKLLFARDECQLDVPFVDEVVAGCIRRGLFDRSVFDMFGVLTSDRIQENYLEGKKRQRTVDLIDDFLVCDDNVYKNLENVNIIDLNVNIIAKNVNKNPQNKRRIKEKEKGEGDSASADQPTEDEKKFEAFQKWISEKAGNVAKMKETFTIDQFLKIQECFAPGTVRDLLLKMHNWKPLLQKNTSAYLTFINWSKKDHNQEHEQSKKLSEGFKACAES